MCEISFRVVLRVLQHPCRCHIIRIESKLVIPRAVSRTRPQLMASSEFRKDFDEIPQQVVRGKAFSERAREAYAPSPLGPTRSASVNMNVNMTVGNGLNGSSSGESMKKSETPVRRYPESTLVSNILTNHASNSNSPSTEEPKVDAVGVLVSRKPLVAKPPDR